MKSKRLWWIILIVAVLGLIIAWVIASYHSDSYSTLTPSNKPHARNGTPCDSPAYKKTHADLCR